MSTYKTLSKLIAFFVFSVFFASFVRGEAINKANEIKPMPTIEFSQAKDGSNQKTIEPSLSVKKIVGIGESNRAYLDVKNELSKLVSRDEDLSDIDVEMFRQFSFKINGQYRDSKDGIPVEVKEIQNEIRQLITITQRLPKNIRQKIPAKILPIAKRMTQYSLSDSFGSDVRAEVRDSLSSMETDAFEFAIKNYEDPSSEISLQLLVVLEDRTLEYFVSKGEASKKLSDSEEILLARWASYVEKPVSICFAIDSLINKETTISQKKNPEVMGRPLRYCDKAFNIAASRFVHSSEWAPNGRLVSLIPIEQRNAQIENFKAWWEEHRNSLRATSKIMFDDFVWMCFESSASDD